MKCFYYLSPTLADTEHVSDDLHASGVNDWFIHIITKNEEGLSRYRLHSGNYLETLDVVREGLIGATLGFCAGLIVAGLNSVFEPFGPDTPLIASIGIVFLFSCFGAWQGGLAGISCENKKLNRFHNFIEEGQYLILVYAHRNEEEKVHGMMSRLHPEAKLVGMDSRFYNPFTEPEVVGL
jgi:hypothetical protein